MTIKNGSIFIQIASYRDPELRPTLKDLLDKADNPDRLHICVCWLWFIINRDIFRF